MPRAIGLTHFASPMVLSQARGFALLAGRKLLLADDSITIQKVVALTFADKGIEVLAVSNGADAIEKLEDFWPDVVLADVYMPEMGGLQVCDYIKRNEKLRHIPVMLLVGSFEPFDEAEARRVGADDTLTKPFQSIRTLVEKVGNLLGRGTAPDNLEKVALADESHTVEDAGVAALNGATPLDGAQTLQFLDREKIEVPEEVMDSAQLERTTADTRPLSAEIRAYQQQQASREVRAIETVVEKGNMETHLAGDSGLELSEGFGDTLLDLGDFEAAPLVASDDVILDIDFETPAPEAFRSAPADNWQSAVAVEAPAASPAVSADDRAWREQGEDVVEWEGEIQTVEREWAPTPIHAEIVVPNVAGRESSVQAAPSPQEFPGPELPAHSTMASPSAPTAEATAMAAPARGQITLEQLSPEVIDAIARRAVEQLSEKVVQEIAWEVVPQLAELLIKRKLEESK